MKKIVLLGFLNTHCSYSYDTCQVQTYPFDGQSNVALDSDILLFASLPNEHPQVTNYPTLTEVDTGREVDVEVIWGATLILSPLEPLKENTEYNLSGTLGNGSRHYAKKTSVASEMQYSIDTVFTTASQPTFWGFFRADTTSEIAVILSEPVLYEDISQCTVTSRGGSALSFVDFDPNNPRIAYYTINQGTISFYLYISCPGFHAEGSSSTPTPFSMTIEEINIPAFLSGVHSCY